MARRNIPFAPRGTAGFSDEARMVQALREDGYAFVPRLLGDRECRDLGLRLGRVARAGERNMLDLPEVEALARSETLLAAVRAHFPREPRPVRGIYFDKSARGNWAVSWHQDVTVAVESQVDVPGFGPWSVKDGVVHAHAPAEVLVGMLTVRIHLDAADEANGALRVIPGSHRHGRLTTAQIQALRLRQSDVLCLAGVGDALLMRPLLAHSSGRSISSRHRRVLHLEYADQELPGGLMWARPRPAAGAYPDEPTRGETPRTAG